MRTLALAVLLLAPVVARAQEVAAAEAAASEGGEAAAPPAPAAAPSATPPAQGAVGAAEASAAMYLPPPSAAGHVPPPPSVGAPGTAAPGLGTPGLYVGPTAAEHAAAERPRRVTDWALVGSGIGLFAGGWLLTWLATSVWYGETTSCSSTGSWSYSCTHSGGPGVLGLIFSFVPVVGPWIMLGDPYLDTAGEILPPILFGLVQDLGLIFLIVGLATRYDAPPEPMAAGDWRLGGSAGPTSAFGTLDVAF
jgi:hypothetical protein